MDATPLETQITAIDEGRAVLEPSGLRATRATGVDTAAWLHDLVTADVEHLAEGDAVRTLLLTPTGRIRADLHVWRTAPGFVLVQPEDQPEDIGALLMPYILSAVVALEPGPTAYVALPGLPAWRFAFAPPPGTTAVIPEAVEAWRIRRGVARFPVDLGADSLPAEAGLDDGVVIDRVKGCFLGQESVAKVRNLGHPARLLVGLRASLPVRLGEPVLAGPAEVGRVTSVDGRHLLARIRWEARDDELHSAAGASLSRC